MNGISIGIFISILLVGRWFYMLHIELDHKLKDNMCTESADFFKCIQGVLVPHWIQIMDLFVYEEKP